MDIIFASKKLEQMCHDDVLATRTLGAPSARKLRARLDDLIAAVNLGYAAKLPGHFHYLSGNRAGQFAMELHGGCRLVLEPANEPLPRRSDRTLDLSKVTTIKVVNIGEYHDETQTNRYRPSTVTPPGATLADLIEERALGSGTRYSNGSDTQIH